MSPLIKTNRTIAANATDFPWQGNQYEFLPFDAMVSVALLGDAGDSFIASVFSGSDVLLQNSPIDLLAVATPITYPDDYALQDVAGAGERLGCDVTDASGLGGTYRTAVQIIPL